MIKLLIKLVIKLLVKLLNRILKLQTVRDSAPRIVVCPGANPPCGVVGVSVLRSHAIRDRSVQILSKLVAVDLPAFSLTRAQHVQGMLLVMLTRASTQAHMLTLRWR